MLDYNDPQRFRVELNADIAMGQNRKIRGVSILCNLYSLVCLPACTQYKEDTVGTTFVGTFDVVVTKIKLREVQFSMNPTMSLVSAELTADFSDQLFRHAKLSDENLY